VKIAPRVSLINVKITYDLVKSIPCNITYLNGSPNMSQQVEAAVENWNEAAGSSGRKYVKLVSTTSNALIEVIEYCDLTTNSPLARVCTKESHQSNPGICPEDIPPGKEEGNIMRMSQQNWTVISLFVILSLYIAGQKITPAAESKAVGPKSNSVESSQVISLKDIVSQMKQVAVFESKEKEKRYIGNLAPNSAALQGFSNALIQGIVVKESGMSRPEYEVVLVGGNWYRLGRYDANRSVFAIYAVQQNELKLTTVVRLTHPLTDILKGAKLSSQPQEKSYSLRESYSLLPTSPSLEKVVQKSPLVLLGTPVATLDNRYDPEVPSRYKVYLIGVEQYLKDETGLDLPIVVLNHPNYPHDPLPQFGKLYLFFLTPPRGNSITVYGTDGRPKKITKIFEPGEYDHFPEALVEKGRATPVIEMYAPDGIKWLKGSEQEVIAKVKAEIKRQQKGRGIR
jgi:hypothetical protein